MTPLAATSPFFRNLLVLDFLDQVGIMYVLMDIAFAQVAVLKALRMLCTSCTSGVEKPDNPEQPTAEKVRHAHTHPHTHTHCL